MFAFQLNRKTVCIALALLTISLASLGVRLPWLTGISSSSAKPKPRPRAIIQNQIKTCKQVMQDIPSTFAILEDTPAISVAVVLLLLLATHVASYRSFPPLQQNSRAPPR